MLNFTEHMKRIIQLAEQSLVHAQAGEFDSAREDIFNISINANESIQQLDDMSLIAYQGDHQQRNPE